MVVHTIADRGQNDQNLPIFCNHKLQITHGVRLTMNRALDFLSSILVELVVSVLHTLSHTLTQLIHVEPG